jgi:ubiquitin-protein ligase E3 B
VRYLGGYHGGHRVIMWFWDITLHEFTDEEKSSLLKFVTSCSKPPLMGFGSMSPPFSIRAVDEAEEGTDQTPGRLLSW